MTNKKLISYLILILCLTPFLAIWCGYMGMEKALSREPVPIFNLVLGSLEFWALAQGIVGLFGWVHHRLLMDYFGKNAKERQLSAIRYGTLALVVLIEIFALLILVGRADIVLVGLYALFFTFVGVLVVGVVTKILGLKRFD